MWNWWECLKKFQHAQKQLSGMNYEDQQLRVLNSSYLNDIKTRPYLTGADNGPVMSKRVSVTTITQLLQQVKDLWNNGTLIPTIR